jgi:hypothetical protein
VWNIRDLSRRRAEFELRRKYARCRLLFDGPHTARIAAWRKVVNCCGDRVQSSLTVSDRFHAPCRAEFKVNRTPTDRPTKRTPTTFVRTHARRDDSRPLISQRASKQPVPFVRQRASISAARRAHDRRWVVCRMLNRTHSRYTRAVRLSLARGTAHASIAARSRKGSAPGDSRRSAVSPFDDAIIVRSGEKSVEDAIGSKCRIVWNDDAGRTNSTGCTHTHTHTQTSCKSTRFSRLVGATSRDDVLKQGERVWMSNPMKGQRKDGQRTNIITPM